MRFEISSVDSVIVYFADEISEDVLKKVSFYYKSLKNLQESSFISIIPSYTSIYIRYDIFKYDFQTIISFLKDKFSSFKYDKNDNQPVKTVNIPVYYSEDSGLDLKRLSIEKNLSIDEIISLHSNKTYLVYAVGFMPGFAYLAKVDKKLQTPRLKHPRDVIPKGSVAIADSQTAVYPKESPGGWNIIGRTPIELFNPNSKELSPFEIGYKVKFDPISKKEFLKMGGKL